MASGYQTSSGSDLDSVFDPYVQGTKPAATGYQTSDGRDLNQRYAPLSFGSAAASTGIKLASGADLNTLWAARGTASYYTPMSNASLSRSSSSKEAISTGNTTLTSDSVTTSVSGGEAPYTYTWQKVSGTTLTVNSQGSAATTFARSAGGVNTTSVYRCKITDGSGASIYTGNITVNFTHYRLNAAAIVDHENIDVAPSYVHAYVGIYRNGSARGGANYVEPVSSTVGDGFEVRFDSSSSQLTYGNCDLATVYTINGSRTIGVTAHQSQIHKPTITKLSDVRVRIRKKNGSWLIDKVVRVKATCLGDGPL
ncbi:hypothetical protein [Microbulbifer discodermiae]|uniref:hypothetical protein n=1 Tax=Microbulbifer sp. 2201CG32-9 TaxID=3232309 RepID=UPI00345B6916